MSKHPEFPPAVSYAMITVMSVALLAMQATIPFKVKELGGGFDAVGFLFTFTSACYIASGLLLGRYSHHLGPRRVMLRTLAVCAVLVLFVNWTTALWQLYLVLGAYFISICLFWAAAEHASTGLHSHFSIVQSTAIYCVAFSVGNGIGMVLSTSLQRHTLAVPFIVSAVLTLVVVALTWWTVAPHTGTPEATPPAVAKFTAAAQARLKRSLRTARLGMVGVYGAYALVSVFLPRYLWEQLHYAKPTAGLLTALTLVTMGAAFAWHGWRGGWPHKLLPVRIAPVIAGAGLILVALATRPAWIALGTLVIGAAAGTGYTHNLYYALEDPRHRARRAGVHEALVGVAFLVPPALSGLATRWTSDPRSIFWVGAGLAATVCVLQTWAWAWERNCQ